MSMCASPGSNAGACVCYKCVWSVCTDCTCTCLCGVHVTRWHNNHVTNSLFQTAGVLVAVLDEVVEAFDGDMDNADFGEM